MNAIEIMVAKTAIKKMMEQGYFTICTIDKVLQISGGIPDPKDYRLLSALHCVHFADMPSELLKELPNLIKRVVESPSLNFYIDISPSSDGQLLTFHEV